MAKKRFQRPSEDDFLISIKSRQSAIPNCPSTQNCVIHKGSQTYKVASVLQFTNPQSGEVSHRELHLNDYPFRIGTGIQWDVKYRLKHWKCKDAEIEKLLAFLLTFTHAHKPGDYTVVEGKPAPTIKELMDILGDLDSPNLVGVISVLAERAAELQTLPPLGERDNRRMVAAALRASHRANSLQDLQRLITDEASEGEFQVLLDRNWWMLGGQYISKVPKRHWTDDENLDMMLQSADGGYDIIEFKRSSATLFKRHRGKLIVSSDVNDAVNQAAHYISEIDRQRDHFIARYNVDLYKVRAKVLLGHIDDNNPECSAMRSALRMYNAHLNNIEVVTFDGIVRISDQIIHANLGESTHSATPTNATQEPD